jgi:flagellar hook-associated protein 1 FlgK
MGLLNSALQIGRSAILSYEGALHAVGNNVSNAGNADYTRLTAALDSVQGVPIAAGLQPGAGVALTDIQRNLDEALEARVRLAIGVQQSALTQQSTMAQVEAFLTDVNGTGVGSQLTEFFHSFDELQNTPEDPAIRDLTVRNGLRLADSMRSLRGQLGQLGQDLDAQIADVVAAADDIAQEIARLNGQITTAEAGQRGQATALRDQRDALLRQLSQYFDVSVREQPDGAINVYVGNETLIQGDVTRGLVAVPEIDGEFVRTSVRFADTNQQVSIRAGRLAGLIISRDQYAYGQIAALDELAAGLIREVNRIHVDGQGLAGFDTLVGAQDVLQTDVPLDSDEAGLTDRPRSGSFFIVVTEEATGTPVAFRIDVDLDGSPAGTTLQSLVDDINAQVNGLTASVTSDDRIALTADDGFTFTLGHDGQQPRADTSGVLAALGLNTFFTGSDAGSIGVNDVLQANSAFLAAAQVFLSGDGSNAGRLAALDGEPVQSLRGRSITDVHNTIVTSVAVTASGVNGDSEAADTILSALRTQRENVSGVNLDEEAISLLKYERAFQGAARFVRTVDDLLAELVSLLS